AVRVSDVLTQVSVWSSPAFTVGVVLLTLTATTSVAVHPFEVLLALTVKLPSPYTAIYRSVWPLLHDNVVPALAVAVRVADVLTQVSVRTAPALTDGEVLFALTVTKYVAVHPFEVLIAVTVKLAAAVTVMEEVVWPLLDDHV